MRVSAGRECIEHLAGHRGLARTCPAVANNLPFLMDDTKLCQRREDVQQLIYDFSQETHQGTRIFKGIAAQSTFRSVLLTSGEQPATSFTEAGGT